jgi:hypothetical protein
MPDICGGKQRRVIGGNEQHLKGFAAANNLNPVEELCGVRCGDMII